MFQLCTRHALLCEQDQTTNIDAVYIGLLIVIVFILP